MVKAVSTTTTGGGVAGGAPQAPQAQIDPSKISLADLQAMSPEQQQQLLSQAQQGSQATPTITTEPLPEGASPELAGVDLAGEADIAPLQPSPQETF